jgi:hypothetical protein
MTTPTRCDFARLAGSKTDRAIDAVGRTTRCAERRRTSLRDTADLIVVATTPIGAR